QARAGDVASWGFKKTGGTVQTSSIVELTARFEPFLKSGITATERKALTKYTSNAYREMNAAWTGSDKNPSPTPKSAVQSLTTAFEKFAQHDAGTEPMTVMRGARVPSGWSGSTDEYMSKAFAVGARVDLSKVNSGTTRPQI